MNSRKIFYFPAILFFTVFLYSCGSSSNGLFEKRKHMKGWHFNKTKGLNNGPISYKENQNIKKNKKVDMDSTLLISLSILESNETKTQRSNFKQTAQEKRLINTEDNKNNPLEIQSYKSTDFIDLNIEEQVEFNQNDNYSTVLKEREIVNKEEANGPLFANFFQMLGITIMAMAYLTGVMILFSFMIDYNVILSLIIVGVLLYLGYLAYDFFTMQIKNRDLGNYDWTLKQSLVRTSIRFGIFVIGFSILFFIFNKSQF